MFVLSRRAMVSAKSIQKSSKARGQNCLTRIPAMRQVAKAAYCEFCAKARCPVAHQRNSCGQGVPHFCWSHLTATARTLRVRR